MFYNVPTIHELPRYTSSDDLSFKDWHTVKCQWTWLLMSVTSPIQPEYHQYLKYCLYPHSNHYILHRPVLQLSQICRYTPLKNRRLLVDTNGTGYYLDHFNYVFCFRTTKNVVASNQHFRSILRSLHTCTLCCSPIPESLSAIIFRL